MQTEIKQWGNSAAIRLPAQLVSALGLSIDSPIDMHLEDGRIVIEPVQSPEYDLQTLLKASTEEQFALDDNDREWLDVTPVGREEGL